jgi:hypothetical protein
VTSLTAMILRAAHALPEHGAPAQRSVCVAAGCCQPIGLCCQRRQGPLHDCVDAANGITPALGRAAAAAALARLSRGCGAVRSSRGSSRSHLGPAPWLPTQRAVTASAAAQMPQQTVQPSPRRCRLGRAPPLRRRRQQPPTRTLETDDIAAAVAAALR